MRPRFVTLVFIAIVMLINFIIFFILYSIVMDLIYGRPKNNPKKFLKKSKKKRFSRNLKKRIIFVGDSLTHGIVSTNYIKLIENELGKNKYHYINAGINSHLAFNVLMRIDEIVACNPDIATIMIGTNDAHREMKLYKETRAAKRLNLPQVPTKEWFEGNLLKVISILLEKTEAKIAICSIPPIGEIMDHPAFKQSVDYSKLIKKVAEEKKLVYIPVNETLINYLEENPSEPKFNPDHKLTETAFAKYFLLGHSFDKMSKHYGFNLMVDHLHLNTKAAQIVADLIKDFILSQDS